MGRPRSTIRLHGETTMAAREICRDRIDLFHVKRKGPARSDWPPIRWCYDSASDRWGSNGPTIRLIAAGLIMLAAAGGFYRAASLPKPLASSSYRRRQIRMAACRRRISGYDPRIRAPTRGAPTLQRPVVWGRSGRPRGAPLRFNVPSCRASQGAHEGRPYAPTSRRVGAALVAALVRNNREVFPSFVGGPSR